ncbi:MAG TPA: nuclear transport factor 2 family protein [Dehalococcoidia bacterium]|nr:nuclear transport factor 2 family protein [Dehalococcoidia bacterium]
MSDDINLQIANLTAIEEIKKLKAIYCSYCDNNYDPDGLAGLFIENGIWDGGAEFGRHEGKQAIKDFFTSASGSIVFAAHLVMNPIINVNDDVADGKWRLIMPCTVNNDEGVAESKWLLSAYTKI